MRITVDPNARFNEGAQPDLGSADIRFTSKGKTLFAFVQGWPQNELLIQALGSAKAPTSSKVVDVRMLGRDEPLSFVRGDDGLRIKIPNEKPSTADIGIALRINLA